MKSLLSLGFFCLVPLLFISAQSADYRHITLEQGLSQGMVFDLLQTRDGFLWVATKDGLNRYDGYNFQIFSNDPFNPFSLSDDKAIFLFEDSRGWLWIGLENKGIDVYDRITGKFHHIPLNLPLRKTNESFLVRNIVEDRAGNIWAIQSGGGLVQIRIPSQWNGRLPGQADLSRAGIIAQIPLEGFDKASEILIRLCIREDGTVQLYSTARQYRLTVGQSIARPVVERDLPAYMSSLSPGPGTSNNEIWILGNTNELFLSTPERSIRFQSPVRWVDRRHSVQDDGAGNIWLLYGTKIWQLRAGQPIDFSRPDWELDREATCIKTDRNGNIWVGTSGYGLRVINPKRRLFHTEVQRNSIWRLWRSPKGSYYWRHISAIQRYHPADPSTAERPAFPELGEDRQMDMLFDSTGAFWMLGWAKIDNNKGILWRYDSNGRLQRTLTFPIKGYDYMRLLEGRSGQIWITGAGCQLVRFDPGTGRFDYFDYQHLFGEKASMVQALALVEDGKGIFWIGTQLGLVKATWTGSTFDFRLFQTDPQNPQGLNNNSIACLLPDPLRPGEVLWIGTKGGGINRLDISTDRFQHLTIADGLPDKVVYGMLPGNDFPVTEPLILWCSTNQGLAKVVVHSPAPLSFEITTFTAAKGLQDNEFNTQAYSKAGNGELLFGGVNGLNRFFPQQLRSDTMPPPVFVVGLEINHQSVPFGVAGSPLEVPVEYLHELELDYDQNNLSFEFAALDFTDPSQNRYRYQLVGLDAGWVETGGIRFAHFTHLAPGRYEFRVQGSNGESDWGEASHPIVVIVHPPWYRSHLAYLVYLFILLWAGWRLYQFQIRRLKERELLVFEQREIERVKAMEQTKTNFFSNITHEFRTPLTLILEPARRILAKTADPEIRENASHVEANSKRLLTLVNQLLDMAKLESGSMGTDLRIGDLEEQIRVIYRSFLPLAEQRDIRMSLKLPGDIPLFSFDHAKVDLVLNNLISNALKFTPAGGAVTVACQNDPSPQQRIQISVRDTGIGIPANALAKIFDRFYQVDTSHTRMGGGTGIGLALSRDLAALMGGDISVTSEPDNGSVFTFSLPVHMTDPVLPSAKMPPHEPPEEFAKALTALASGGRPSVLLIEDNTELRTFIKAGIAATWQVAEASDGQEGIEKALELLPDLVISDIMMPLKDGYDVCDTLKNNELTSHIPVILLTAKSATDAKIKGFRSGADDYLSKPFNSVELLARMESLVENRRRLRQHYSRRLSAVDLTEPLELADFLTPPDRDFLRRFTLTVEQHLSDETIGVEDFARKMYVSRTQLHRKLKAITDRNVTDFVRDYRLDRAMSMLRNREGLVYEVASKVGFGNEKYFSRVFKDKFGMPPSRVN